MATKRQRLDHADPGASERMILKETGRYGGTGFESDLRMGHSRNKKTGLGTEPTFVDSTLEPVAGLPSL